MSRHLVLLAVVALLEDKVLLEVAIMMEAVADLTVLLRPLTTKEIMVAAVHPMVIREQVAEVVLLPQAELVVMVVVAAAVPVEHQQSQVLQ